MGFPLSWTIKSCKIVLFRLDSLMFGVLGAFIWLDYKAFWLSARRGGVVLGTLLLSVCFILFYSLDLDNSRFACVGLFPLLSLSILCFLPALESWSIGPSSIAGPVRNLSLWSYSLYLSHIALIMVTRSIMDYLTERGPVLSLTPFPIYSSRPSSHSSFTVGTNFPSPGCVRTFSRPDLLTAPRCRACFPGSPSRGMRGYQRGSYRYRKTRCRSSSRYLNG